MTDLDEDRLLSIIGRVAILVVVASAVVGIGLVLLERLGG